MKRVRKFLKDYWADIAIGVFSLLIAVHNGLTQLLPLDAWTTRLSLIVPFIAAGLVVALLNWTAAWLFHRRRRRGEDWDSWTSPWLALVWGVIVVDALVLASPSLLVPSSRQSIVAEVVFAASGAGVCAVSMWMHCMAFGFRYELLPEGKIVSVQMRALHEIRFPHGNRDALKAEIEWLRTMQLQIFWGYGFVLVGLVLGLDKLPGGSLRIWFIAGTVLVVLGFHMLVTGPVLHYFYMLLGFLHEYPDSSAKNTISPSSG